jgi:quercetin dioxygenase-like cupin family protein
MVESSIGTVGWQSVSQSDRPDYTDRMNKQIVLPGGGKSYDWSKDHVFVKARLELSDGRLTLVEDHLKSGFFLARHHHKKMIEIFYVLEGVVEFAFDDETVIAQPGTTISVPPEVRHAVRSPGGARLLTIFSPGGFDDYLEELVALTESQYADAGFMQALSERYDIFDG